MPRRQFTGCTISTALMLVLFWPQAAGAKNFFVDAASASNPDCDSNSVQNPFRALDAAEACAKLLQQDSTIFIMCTAPGKCTHSPPAGRVFEQHPDGYRIAIRGEPEGEVTIFARVDPEEPANTNPIRIENRRSFFGLRLDGGGGNSTQQSGSFIRIEGNDVELVGNEITNTGFRCLTLAIPGSSTAQFTNITIAHNRIHGCYQTETDKFETHCIYNQSASEVQILFNDIFDCGADGYQIENYRAPYTPNVPVALTNSIIGTRIYSRCHAAEGIYSIPFSPGENAIDIKRAGRGVAIRDNFIWGYRQSYDKTVPCHGIGDGAFGGGIAISGVLEDGTGLPCALAPCALAEGNTLTNCGEVLRSVPQRGRCQSFRMASRMAFGFEGISSQT